MKRPVGLKYWAPIRWDGRGGESAGSTQGWVSRCVVLEEGRMCLFVNDTSMSAESMNSIWGEPIITDMDTPDEVCIDVHARGDGGTSTTISILLPRSDCPLWHAALHSHIKYSEAAYSHMNTYALSESGEDCGEERNSQIIVCIEGKSYPISVTAAASAGDLAQETQQLHQIDPEYLPAIEMEILRAQVSLGVELRAAFSKARAAYLEQTQRCAVATSRAALAEQSNSRLNASLASIEAILLALGLGGGAGAPFDRAALVRQLCEQSGVAAGDSGAGAISKEEWALLCEQEDAVLRNCDDSEGADHRGLTWRERYFAVRAAAFKLAESAVDTENALQATRFELLEQRQQEVGGRDHALDSLMKENRGLREQTVLLRGEILRLRDNITEVKAAAAHAMQSVSAFGKDMARLPLSVADAEGAGIAGSEDGELEEEEVDQLRNLAQARADGKEPFRHTPSRSGERESKAGTAGVPMIDMSPLHDGYSPEQYRAPGATDAPAATDAEGPAEDELELALRSAHVPVVSERLLKLLFERYISKEGKFLMNSFRYLRCLKECGITATEEDGHGHGHGGHGSARWLSYGVVSIIFSEALKVKTDDSAVATGAASSSAVNSYVRSTSTVLTLKGSADSRASAISYQQFLVALRHLALRLYADVIEEEFGVAVELLKDPVRETAAYQALELMIQDKLVVFAVKKNFMPWPLVHLERALFALQQIAVAFTPVLVAHSDLLTGWFLHYAVGTSTGSAGLPPNGKRAGYDGRLLRVDDTGAVALTYKALSRFAHDFGIVPYLLKEPELFGLFQEMMVWTGPVPKVSAEALPAQVLAALTNSLNRAASPERLAALPRVKPSADRVGLSAFIVALCIVAMQAFTHDPDGARPAKLVSWLQQGGGPSIIARS